jgi:hypothetical protein
LADDESRIRITIFSPNSVGSVETRKSIALGLRQHELHPPVLRHALLGDVEPRDHLDPRRDLVLDRERRLRDLRRMPSIRGSGSR